MCDLLRCFDPPTLVSKGRRERVFTIVKLLVSTGDKLDDEHNQKFQCRGEVHTHFYFQ